MTEYQFVKLVKEMRRLQVDYKRTCNMRLWSTMGRMEAEVDAAIISYETKREKKSPVQQPLTSLFNVEPSKSK